MIIFALVGIVLIGAIVYTAFNAKRQNKEVIKCRTGIVGSGKSYLCSTDIVKHYKKCYRKWKRSKGIFRWLWKIIPNGSIDLKPMVWSNIPFYLGKYPTLVENKKGKFVMKKCPLWANVLTREHLLLEKFFGDDCTPIVFIDEVGMLCNQYSYNDPNIVSSNINDNYKCVETFIRFFRHYYGEHNNDNCRLYLTDQASGGMNISIRRRISFVDYLSNFHRFLGFLPFYKVDVRSLLLCEDNMQNVNETNGEQGSMDPEYYFGFLPYKWMGSRHYDSHAYHGTKYTGFNKTVDFTNWSDNDYSYINSENQLIINQYQTNYCPDLRMTEKEKSAYKQHLQSLGLSVRDVRTQ